MIADLLIAFGFLVLTHGLTVAVVALGVLLVTFTAVVAVHNRRRPQAAPAPIRPAVGSAVVGRPIRTHRRRSGAIVRHPKTGVTR